MALIRATPKRDGQELLFGRSTVGYRTFSSSKCRLDQLSGVEGWVLHDLRRAFVTGLSKLKVSIEVCEMSVNHISGVAKGGITGTYNQNDYFPEIKAAMQKWARKVEQMVENKPERKVIPYSA